MFRNQREFIRKLVTGAFFAGNNTTTQDLATVFLDTAINNGNHLTNKKALLKQLSQIAQNFLKDTNRLSNNELANNTGLVVLEALRLIEDSTASSTAEQQTLKVKLFLAKMAIRDLDFNTPPRLAYWVFLGRLMTFAIGLVTVLGVSLLFHSGWLCMGGLIFFSVGFALDEYSLTTAPQEGEQSLLQAQPNLLNPLQKFSLWNFSTWVDAQANSINKLLATQIQFINAMLGEKKSFLVNMVLFIARIVFGLYLSLSILFVPLVMNSFALSLVGPGTLFGSVIIINGAVLSALAALFFVGLLAIKYNFVNKKIKYHVDTGNYQANLARELFDKLPKFNKNALKHAIPEVVYLFELYLSKRSLKKTSPFLEKLVSAAIAEISALDPNDTRQQESINNIIGKLLCPEISSSDKIIAFSSLLREETPTRPILEGAYIDYLCSKVLNTEESNTYKDAADLKKHLHTLLHKYLAQHSRPLHSDHGEKCNSLLCQNRSSLMRLAQDQVFFTELMMRSWPLMDENFAKELFNELGDNNKRGNFASKCVEILNNAQNDAHADNNEYIACNALVNLIEKNAVPCQNVTISKLQLFINTVLQDESVSNDNIVTLKGFVVNTIAARINAHMMDNPSENPGLDFISACVQGDLQTTFRTKIILPKSLFQGAPAIDDNIKSWQKIQKFLGLDWEFIDNNNALDRCKSEILDTKKKVYLKALERISKDVQKRCDAANSRKFDQLFQDLMGNRDNSDNNASNSLKKYLGEYFARYPEELLKIMDLPQKVSNISKDHIAPQQFQQALLIKCLFEVEPNKDTSWWSFAKSLIWSKPSLADYLCDKLKLLPDPSTALRGHAPAGRSGA